MLPLVNYKNLKILTFQHYFESTMSYRKYMLVGWFPSLCTRAYGNNGRRPRQKFVFGILQLYLRLGCHAFSKIPDIDNANVGGSKYGAIYSLHNLHVGYIVQ